MESEFFCIILMLFSLFLLLSIVNNLLIKFLIYIWIMNWLLWSTNLSPNCLSTSIIKETSSLSFHRDYTLSYNSSSPRERYLSYTLSLVRPIYLPIKVHFLPNLSTRESSFSTSYLLHCPWRFKEWKFLTTYL
jgi:hypothetical protein